MEVLVLGASSIARRRVLKALANLPEVGLIHLASRGEVPVDILPAEKRGGVFRGYDAALKELPPSVVYVSLPNSLHAEWCGKALEAGFHVIVDKPAFVSLSDLRAMLDLAQRSDLCLAEATVWNFHPQICMLLEHLAQNELKLSRVTTVFSVPPFPPENFRWRPELGGGSLWDLGPYAASCSRVFFGERPAEVVCRVHSYAPTGIDSSFSILAHYTGDRAMVGLFGFTTEYENSVSLLGPEIFANVDRVFTIPPQERRQTLLRHNNVASTLSAPAGDSFGEFLQAVLQSIGNRTWFRFRESLEADAQFLNSMRESAGVA